MARQLPKNRVIPQKLLLLMKSRGRMRTDDMYEGIPEATKGDIKYGLKILIADGQVIKAVDLMDTRRKIYYLKSLQI